MLRVAGFGVCGVGSQVRVSGFGVCGVGSQVWPLGFRAAVVAWETLQHEI